MKLIIAGSRSITNYEHLTRAIDLTPYYPLITAIVSGNCRGADLLGERYARENNIPLEIFPAQWDILGPGAGKIRNAQMAVHADALLSLWDGHSPGTLHMTRSMNVIGKPSILYHISTGELITNNLQHLTMYPEVRKGGPAA